MIAAPAGPVPPAVLDELADAIATGATIVGLGESTRFAHETFDVRDRVFRRLVRRHGFRALALQDDASVGARLDAYVTGGAGSVASALDGAWRPWRTAETAAALDWIRSFNQDHPHDPVRIFGVKPGQARPADYEAVLDHVRVAAPGRLVELQAHLAPIRTAHQTDEHVQRARGRHPGRPFADHARDALAIVERLPDDAVLAPMRRIVDFHERSVAGRDSYAGDARAWAETIMTGQRRTGRPVAYWDGIAHTAATPATLGLAPVRDAQPTVGSVLRDHQGAGYVSVAIGFHHGDLGIAVVPAPAPDWLDARLAATGRPAAWLDLRADDVRRRWDGPATVRVVSGVYDPARDAAEHLIVDRLSAAFDVLVHLRRVTPVRWLA
ncbi:erythromycin esterase family protein [Krasilnikovia sp. M28-CT-15]|uniref:erythromycin esterase family protein n=1 Tax=Krasilnikovia sp. M28-CT-15 TaxID=3373540 RepID=UPI003877088D